MDNVNRALIEKDMSLDKREFQVGFRVQYKNPIFNSNLENRKGTVAEVRKRVYVVFDDPGRFYKNPVPLSPWKLVILPQTIEEATYRKLTGKDL
jgi:hypothetical protein